MRGDLGTRMSAPADPNSAPRGAMQWLVPVLILALGTAGSWTLSNRGPQVIERDWRPGFMIDLQQKDIRLILEAADELGVPLLGCSTAFHLYRTLQSLGCGAEGNHALV